MTKKFPLPCPLFDKLAYVKKKVTHKGRELLANFTFAHAAEIGTEFDLCLEFLRSYNQSPDTFNAYRRELERFLQWLWIIRHKMIKAVTRNDLRDYLDFVKNPHESWIGTKTVTRFVVNAGGERIINPQWRPFVVKVNKLSASYGHTSHKSGYQLSNKSLAAIFSCLSSFFVFLQQESYLEINPISLLRQKKAYLQRTQTRKITRKLSNTQWDYVLSAAEQMATENTYHERTLFLISAFYLLGLRISELAYADNRMALMNNFAPDKNGLWWYTTIGKGNKLRDVAVPDELMTALKRYRQHLGLNPLPTRGESNPLLPRSRGKNGLGSRQIRNLVQQVFNRAIVELNATGKTDEAQDLAIATVHWLRHTAISNEVGFRPREHIRDDVGHDNPATMEQYIDTDRVSRHASAQKKRLRPSSSTKTDDAEHLS